LAFIGKGNPVEILDPDAGRRVCGDRLAGHTRPIIGYQAVLCAGDCTGSFQGGKIDRGVYGAWAEDVNVDSKPVDNVHNSVDNP
jgi:hypothetical protein